MSNMYVNNLTGKQASLDSIKFVKVIPIEGEGKSTPGGEIDAFPFEGKDIFYPQQLLPTPDYIILLLRLLFYDVI